MSSREPSPVSPDAGAGYERRDVRISALVWLALSVTMGVLAVTAVLWLLLVRFEGQAKRADPQITPLAAEQPEEPRAPHLQTAPVEDFQALRQAQEEKLHSYGWVDRKEEVVHIPIARAMELALERGLPAPQEASPQEPETKTP